MRNLLVKCIPLLLLAFASSLFASSETRELLIPPAAHDVQLTVVFDLDETLVSNRNRHLFEPPSLRPGIIETLAMVRSLPGVELILWTASTTVTATDVVAYFYLDTLIQAAMAGRSEGSELFDHMIFRETKNWYDHNVSHNTKDLRLLGRDMGRVIMFDNSPMCCNSNPECAVLVHDYEGNQQIKDATMPNISALLIELRKELSRGKNRSVPKILHTLTEDGLLEKIVYQKSPVLDPHTVFLRVPITNQASRHQSIQVNIGVFVMVVFLL